MMVCKFDIVETNFLLILPLFVLLCITQALQIIFHLKWFYSEILFSFKLFILIYSLDIVSTVSYSPCQTVPTMAKDKQMSLIVYVTC